VLVSDLEFVVSSWCHSGGCVGVAALPDGGVAVRDTKADDGPIHTFTGPAWTAFLDAVATREFD
jgi:Domain of unknown function (DUF397)